MNSYARRHSDNQKPLWARYSGRRKIEAIQAVREVFGIPLLEAKDVVLSPYFMIGEHDLDLLVQAFELRCQKRNAMQSQFKPVDGVFLSSERETGLRGFSFGDTPELST